MLGFKLSKDAEAALNAKYEIMEVLGVGSTSTCHRCIAKASGKHYACKVIDKRLIEERFQGMMEQFQTEIEALRSLNHPNIIQMLDVYITEEKISIVMELMEGGELFDYVVQKGTLTEKEASTIVRKVTSALVYMHSKNIVHRDLKPENLLLRRKPTNSSTETVEVKIIDFGLSKVGELHVLKYSKDTCHCASTWPLSLFVRLFDSVWKKSLLREASWGLVDIWPQRCCNAGTTLRLLTHGRWVLSSSYSFVVACLLMMILKQSLATSWFGPSLC
jgi:serine/threonine protein kinase